MMGRTGLGNDQWDRPQLMTRLPYSMQTHLGQVLPMSQVFWSISGWTKEHEPGHSHCLNQVRG